jgi:hypothetical protein
MLTKLEVPKPRSAITILKELNLEYGYFFIYSKQEARLVTADEQVEGEILIVPAIRGG